MIALLLGAVAFGQLRPEEMDLGARDARAREIYENGSTLYQEGLYEDAIAAFQESYRLSGLHRMLLNVVNCYERMGRYEEAIAVLNRYRAFATAEDRERVRSRIAENQRRIDETVSYRRTGVQPLPIPPLQPVLPRTASAAEPPGPAAPAPL